MARAPKIADPRVAARRDTLRARIEAFCDERLNAEYKRLCLKLLDAWVRAAPEAIVRGRENTCAAAVVHAIGSINGLFYSDSRPRVSAQEIADAFGASGSGVSTRATALKEIMEFSGVPVEGFLTRRSQTQSESLNDLLVQMAGLLEQLPPDEARELLAESGLEGMFSEQATLDEDGTFVDADHPVSDAFYRLADGRNDARTRTKLRQLIERDPDFYDSYIALAERVEPDEARALRRTACARAVARVAPQGQWPRRIEWGFLENRHILRALLNEAIARWGEDDRDGAASLFRRLLAICPEDNVGARDYLLALREGMTFEGFEQEFTSDFGYDALKMMRWFDANVGKYPDDFAAWLAEVQQAAEEA